MHSPKPTTPDPDFESQKGTILLVATVASFLTPFMGSSITVALPPIGREFAANAIAMSWVPTAYLLAAAVFLVPFGRLADIRGRKKVFTIGIAIYTIASLLSAVAPSIYWLIGFRILQGMGGAMIFSTGVAIVTSVYPPGERGKVFGWVVTAVYSGLSLGPFAGGILTQHFGWRSVFYLNLFLGTIPFVLMLWKVKGEWAEAKGEKFDLIGSLIYGVALVTLMIGLSELPDLIGAGMIVAGVAGLVGFTWWELKCDKPVLNIDLFRKSRVFAFSNLAAFINYSATFGVTFLISLYLQYVKGLTPQGAGSVLVSMPIMMALLSPYAGKLSDRLESRVVASIGMGITVVALAILSFVSLDTPLWFIVAALALNGIGFAFFSSPNTNAVMSSIDKKYYGVGSATQATMRLTGQMFSMGLAMLILAVIVGKVEITPEHYAAFVTSTKTAFVLFASMCFVGVFVSLARGNMRGSDTRG
jgi:EmrB/QacA subfamily drug resistance transporter